MSGYRGRFAPSPTGRLHFGSLVAAVGSFLQARAHAGAWLVRMEDIDPPREMPGAARAILDSLAAFGLVSDEPVLYQSARKDAYAEALSALELGGWSFDCGCSRRDLPRGGVYPGTCRDGLPAGRRARSIRVRVGKAAVTIRDAIQGEFTQDLGAEVGDFVVRRADGLTAYQLAVVVDDQYQDITEIVRGSDLLVSTPRQAWLMELLGISRPAYAHLPVAVDENNRKLSKQTMARPVDDDDPAPALAAALEFLGHPPPARLRRGSLRDLWRFAESEWHLDRVPRLRTAPLPL